MGMFSVFDYIAFGNMLIFWQFYDMYSRDRSFKKDDSIMKLSDRLRTFWVHNAISSDENKRIPDAQLVNLLHRGISFFITITVFIVAGLLTMLTTDDAILQFLQKLPFRAENVEKTWVLKVILIMFVFVAAFFRLTWALRQNHYYSVAIFAVPSHQKDNTILVKKISSLISDSAKNFNNALRSFYFGVAMFTWLINPIIYFIVTILVVWIIYRREFKSKTRLILTDICNEISKSETKKDLFD